MRHFIKVTNLSNHSWNYCINVDKIVAIEYKDGTTGTVIWLDSQGIIRVAESADAIFKMLQGAQ